MAKEHEIDILEVDRAEAARRLKQLGADYNGHVRYRRIEWLIGGRIGKMHSWGRVRTDGKNTTITVKRFRGKHLPMDEHEISANSFEEAVRLVSRLTRSKIFYFENERDIYRLDGATITLDKWPLVPLFMEIESRSMSHANELYKRLGIKGELVGNATIDSIFKRYGLDFRKEMSRNNGKLERILKP
ncbi:MAG: CYTH domain-containing protein [Candidatus Micrarchaeota archaeon]|nr:CYTH domain-containing protein [Candidatus Micrarchaeota archaeon]